MCVHRRTVFGRACPYRAGPYRSAAPCVNHYAHETDPPTQGRATAPVAAQRSLLDIKTPSARLNRRRRAHREPAAVTSQPHVFYARPGRRLVNCASKPRKVSTRSRVHGRPPALVSSPYRNEGIGSHDRLRLPTSNEGETGEGLARSKLRCRLTSVVGGERCCIGNWKSGAHFFCAHCRKRA